MRPIPAKLKKALEFDPFYDRCCITGRLTGGFGGREKIEWHHNLKFAGRQVNERWCILPVSQDIHKRAKEPEIRERLDRIMLNRATDEQLRKYSRAVDLIKKRDQLNKMKYLSLFSGIGGFELGMPPDWECVGYSEIDKRAIEIYQKHFPQHKNYGDITKIKAEDLPEFDLVVGGFPCQSFSIAGKRGGFNDTRGTLFFDIARILKAKQPRLLLLENVKGLLSSHTTLTFDGILDTLSTELSVKENICLNYFQPIKEWETESDNLSAYLHSTGKTSGLQRNFVSLAEKILPIIKKQNLFPQERTIQSELKEEEWASNLLRLSLIDNLKISDIPLLEKMVVINAEIVSLWKKALEESSPKKKLSTTLTEENQTTELGTCISVLQELNIILFITKQWKLSTNLWNKINLNLRKENTYYVKTFNIIISTLDELGYDLQWQVLNSKNFGVPQNRERVFIIGNLRGTSRPKVFPFGETDRTINKRSKQKDTKSEIASTVRSRYGNGTGSHLIQKIGGSQGMRVYGSEGLSVTIAGLAGGMGAKTGLYTIPVLTPDRPNKRQNGRRFKEDGDPSFTLTSQDKHGVFDGMKIRRLTPTECERLQGFPDGWTEGISDSQRYKCLGNAVTVNVIKEIIKKINAN